MWTTLGVQYAGLGRTMRHEWGTGPWSLRRRQILSAGYGYQV